MPGTPPVYLGFTPPAAAQQGAYYSFFVLRFDRGVRIKFGSAVTLTGSDGTNWDISANVILIGQGVVFRNLPLKEGVTYQFAVAAGGVIADETAQPLTSGVSGSFTVPLAGSDSVAPQLVAYEPTTLVPAAGIRLQFSEEVVKGSGFIRIYNHDGTLFEAISVDKVFSVSGYVNIPVSKDYAPGAGYYVTIDAGAFRDLTGNSYAGIAGPDDFTFVRPGDTDRPRLNEVSPAQFTGLVARNTNILLYFNEPVVAASGVITISSSGKLHSVDIHDASQVSISGKIITIDLKDDLEYDTSYAIMVPDGIVADLSGNLQQQGFLPTYFRTEKDPLAPPPPPPPLAPRALDTDETSIKPTISLSFDTVITRGAGNITFHRTDGSVIETIPVTDRERVYLQGYGLRVHPNATLPPSTSYYITLDEGVVTDADGRHSIAVTASTALPYQTIAATPLVEVAGYQTIEWVPQTGGGFNVGLRPASGSSLIIHGDVIGSASSPISDLRGVFFATTGSSADAIFENYGTVEVVAPSYTVYGVDGSSHPPGFYNASSGAILAAGYKAIAVRWNGNDTPVINDGLISAYGLFQATGLAVTGGVSAVINRGMIAATTTPGYGNEIVALQLGNSQLVNRGSVFSDFTGVMLAGDSNYTNPGEFRIINSGTIEAPTAIVKTATGGSMQHAGLRVLNEADGVIMGSILLDTGGNEIYNLGEISGAVQFGPGASIFDGAQGTLNGSVFGGAGNDVLSAGAGNATLSGGAGMDTLNGGLGDDTLDGGSNVDTAILSGNRAAYTIVQTDPGHFSVTGPDGADILLDIEYVRFDDQTLRLLRGEGSSIASDPASYMGAIRDFDGNNLTGQGTQRIDPATGALVNGPAWDGVSGWTLAGTADVSGGGVQSHILFNSQIGRWAEVAVQADGKVYFDNHAWAGDTRIVGIYVDPLVQSGAVAAGGDEDSQRRFQNDLFIGNLKSVLHAGDYDKDGGQEVYFSLTDGTAYLHTYMHADGNIRYANYQSKQQVQDYLAANSYGGSVTWLAAAPPEKLGEAAPAWTDTAPLMAAADPLAPHDLILPQSGMLAGAGI